MRQVIVAFESRANRERIRDILESTGEFSCLLCQNGDEVRRVVRKLRLDIVVCGFKLGEESSESVFFDLPQRCVMLMIAPQDRLGGTVSPSAPRRSGSWYSAPRRCSWTATA